MPPTNRISFLSLSIVILLGFAMTGTAQSELSRRDSEALSQASLIYIATVRKDGNQSTAAPVWFTKMPDSLILIQTAHTSWKARRIRRGSPVIVWIGSRSGPAFIANAAITNEPAVISRIVTDYPKRYLLARIGLHTPTNEKFASGQIVAIKIIPVRDLPDGFKSAPGSPASILNEKASNQDSLPD
jgi:Pyridoxamine 5'-phosphate oxidase